MKVLRDVFLCHASEDKEAVVRPLAAALRAAGVTCWVDEPDIEWGASFTRKVGSGLVKSRYVIAVISHSFIGKAWPEYELDAALGMEASEGEEKVLPLLVGSKDDLLGRVRQKYPLLGNRPFLFWEGSPKPIVEAVQVRLTKGDSLERPAVKGTENDLKRQATYIPKLQQAFTQRDKDRFLNAAFATIRNYFQRAVGDLQASYEEADADFIEVDNEKFRCRLYLRGELQNQCLIRVGTFTSGDSIGYTEGTRFLKENSYNEIITVADDESELYLKFTFGSFLKRDRQEELDPKGAAEALWRRFVSPLER